MLRVALRRLAATCRSEAIADHFERKLRALDRAFSGSPAAVILAWDSSQSVLAIASGSTSRSIALHQSISLPD